MCPLKARSVFPGILASWGAASGALGQDIASTAAATRSDILHGAAIAVLFLLIVGICAQVSANRASRRRCTQRPHGDAGVEVSDRRQPRRDVSALRNFSRSSGVICSQRARMRSRQ